MEDVRGTGRGSYIWGRSVHNIRIERMWVDVTAGYGNKWKEFFRSLEALHGLNVDNDSHVWLVHHLFLDAINRDAMQWAATWNQHTLARRNDSHLSPAQLYVQGLAIHGQRGLFNPDTDTISEEDVERNRSSDDDYADYGIDWDEAERRHIRRHHDENNPDDGDPTNPFQTHPARLSHVEVPDPRCPYAPEQVSVLDAHLSTLPCFSRGSMQDCLELWLSALHFVQTAL
ncbi:hypothetical protein C2E23DRAFT_736029 [Lenzites betulinus]|nr:hypothetical protein C2E23DRAFT_736029 [Lenzites betulinus]